VAGTVSVIYSVQMTYQSRAKNGASHHFSEPLVSPLEIPPDLSIIFQIIPESVDIFRQIVHDTGIFWRR
jgi:hypothetical protein